MENTNVAAEAESNQPVVAKVERVDFATTLNDVWQLAQTKIWNLLGIYLIVTLFTIIAIIFATIVAFIVGFIINLAGIPALLVAFLALALIALIALIFWLSAMMLIASLKSLDSAGNPSVLELVSEAKSQSWALVPTMVIAMFAVLGGFALFIVPGIIMFVSTAFVVNVAVLEKKSTWEAIVRSRDLVRGRWWNLFILWIGLGIAAALIIAATGMSYSPLMLIIYPLSTIFSYVVYKKLASLPAAKPATTRGDWYYKVAAGVGIALVAAGLIAIIFAASTNWDEFKAGFDEGFNEGKSEKYEDSYSKNYYDEPRMDYYVE